MSEPAVLTATEVARKFRRTPRWFRAARRRLQAGGFPPPLPGTSPRPLWSAAEVARWFAREPAAGASEEATSAMLAERAQMLAERRAQRPRK